MAEGLPPFYVQTALLDQYIHAQNPAADSDSLEMVLELLRTRPDLRAYFFQNRPTAAWAPILWEQGFFAAPPPPKESAAIGVFFPRWDAQGYLISVAAQVPDIVLRHVLTFEGPAYYISQTILALCAIPADKTVTVTPRVITWLEDPQIAKAISGNAYELVNRLAQAGNVAEALEIFRALTAPVAPEDGHVRQEPWSRVEAASKFTREWDERRIVPDSVTRLGSVAAAQVTTIMEAHLRTALEIEAQGDDLQEALARSWWRSAIEDTDQDGAKSYKHTLLRCLRNALYLWVQQDAIGAGPTIERYLGESVSILRRLGLSILRLFPDSYPKLLSRTLLEFSNLDDTRIHHEFFLLLEQGFVFLSATEQETLVDTICLGPSEERLGRLAKSVAAEHEVDQHEYIDIQRRLWIRDRLWMIRTHLPTDAARLLQELISRFGEPDHPTFNSWTSGVFRVQDVSPIDVAKLAQMPSEALVEFLAQWRPPTERKPEPEVVSYEGLAKVVAEAVIKDPDKYRSHLASVALLRPEFAFALLDRFREPSEGETVPWEMALDLCENLLAEDLGRANTTSEIRRDWVSVRMWIVRLLEVGLCNPERLIPDPLLGRVRDLLLILIDDPDPDPENDRPAQGWFGHNDPATVAINRVRPSALLALIMYARRVALAQPGLSCPVTPEQPIPDRLEMVVREALTRKLDQRADPSWAVHSVFGQFLPLLHWLDKTWVESHIDDILPMAEDEASRWLFVAAWDSFVIFNDFGLPMLELLRVRYERAIDNLALGFVTESHLQPELRLAWHIAWEYLLGGYDLRSPAGQNSLVVEFCTKTPSKNRGSVAWVLWRICDSNADTRDAYWPRIRALWEWRVQAASEAGRSTDYDDEMQRFAHLLSVVPQDRETISTIWPLLEALLPHMTQPEFPNLAWTELEKYLASEVERDPLKAIQFYRLMHEQLAGPVVYYPEEARRILGTAAASKTARAEALSLIDSIARFGDYRFRDIYERYAR